MYIKIGMKLPMRTVSFPHIHFHSLRESSEIVFPLDAKGFNLPAVLKTVTNLAQMYMNEEKRNNSVGGYSMVALLMPKMGMMQDYDSVYALSQLQYIYDFIPDLNFIYYTDGTITNYQSYVRDPSNDLYSLSIGQTVSTSSQPVLNRIIKSL